MESHGIDSEFGSDFGKVVDLLAYGEAPRVLVVCEHASNRIPERLCDLGLDADVKASHIAWDPGAFDVAQSLAQALSGLLVSAQISRLVYDCNRPPEAASAVPERSEIYEIPGNKRLSVTERSTRVHEVYTPFANKLHSAIEQNKTTLDCLVTIHSFTPVFHGQKRAVELGVLHGTDDRLALAMMDSDKTGAYRTELNKPYSAQDGVAHTLDLHGAQNGLLNVMIEIRNDLIRTPKDQANMAAHLAIWIRKALCACKKQKAAW